MAAWVIVFVAFIVFWLISYRWVKPKLKNESWAALIAVALAGLIGDVILFLLRLIVWVSTGEWV